MTAKSIDTGLDFDNTYAKQLEGFYQLVTGDKASTPQLITLNRPACSRTRLVG